VVALDIDGTLLKWVEGAGMTYEQVEPRVRVAVHRALDAGAHVVLASGRSPHGMTRVADLLGLRGQGEERVWIVASNGAVVLRYPPVEVIHEGTELPLTGAKQRARLAMLALNAGSTVSTDRSRASSRSRRFCRSVRERVRN
jgi:trehalose-6-phosphatase